MLCCAQSSEYIIMIVSRDGSCLGRARVELCQSKMDGYYLKAVSTMAGSGRHHLSAHSCLVYIFIYISTFFVFFGKKMK